MYGSRGNFSLHIMTGASFYSIECVSWNTNTKQGSIQEQSSLQSVLSFLGSFESRS